MHVSISELSSAVSKASVGVGLDQGSANHIGRLTQFIFEYQLCSLAPVVHALTRYDNQQSKSYIATEATDDQYVAANSSPLSAITIVAPLTDSITQLCCGRTTNAIEIINTDSPALVIATALFCSVNWQCQLGMQVVDNDANDISMRLGFSTLTDLSKTTTRKIKLVWSDEVFHTDRKPRRQGAEVTEKNWSTITALANRLLVPASEESRLTGAGAGLNDTD